MPLIWFEFKAHRAGLPPIVGRRRRMGNLPLVLPGHEYAFEFGNSGRSRTPGEDAAAWPPLERVEVTSLMWQDGAVERRQQFPDSPEFQAWLTRIWLDQQQWLARIVLPKL